MALLAAARFAIFGAPTFAVAEYGQAIDAGLGDHNDAAAVATVAAVGAAARNVLLTTKAHAAVAAAAGFDFDGDAIDEHGVGGWGVGGLGTGTAGMNPAARWLRWGDVYKN